MRNSLARSREKLADAFWPGPLTIILPRGSAITPLVSAGRHTVALLPKAPRCRSAASAFGGPIAAPSANRSGFTSPTTAAHVMAELAGRIPLILDGGSCDIGLESTVLDISGDTPTVLRPGAVTLEMLRATIGDVHSHEAVLQPADLALSPGQHSRHYAPHTPAFRFTRDQWPVVEKWAQTQGPVVLLSHDDSVLIGVPSETIRMPSLAADYAQAFYSALREADQKNAAVILLLMPEKTDGLWVAVADRVRLRHRTIRPAC